MCEKGSQGPVRKKRSDPLTATISWQYLRSLLALLEQSRLEYSTSLDAKALLLPVATRAPNPYVAARDESR